MSRCKQVNEMFSLVNRECHKTLNSPKNYRKGEFSKDVKENYNLLLKEVAELMEAIEDEDYKSAYAELPDVINFCAALMWNISNMKEVFDIPAIEVEDWC